MADADEDLGTGTTVTFTGFTANVTNIAPGGSDRESIDTTHLETAVAAANTLGSKTYIPADLSDAGEIVITGHFNPGYSAPIEGAPGSLVITFPSTTTWTAAAAFVTNYTPGSIDVNGLMTFSMTFKISGGIVIAAAA